MRLYLTSVKRALILSVVLAGSPAFADLKLNKENSSLNFLSTKNTSITESHTFDEFKGFISDSGNLELSVDLRSVNTMIPIRNERMQKMLFDVANFNEAKFRAKIAPSLLDLKPGETRNTSISGELTISGKTQEITFDLVLTGLKNNQIAAATIKPAIIDANKFGLDAGIQALREIAKLKDISTSVPFSFYVVFDK